MEQGTTFLGRNVEEVWMLGPHQCERRKSNAPYALAIVFCRTSTFLSAQVLHDFSRFCQMMIVEIASIKWSKSIEPLVAIRRRDRRD
jgi:hypothetical protein